MPAPHTTARTLPPLEFDDAQAAELMADLAAELEADARRAARPARAAPPPRRPLPPRRLALQPLRRPASPADADEPTAAAGCGWFDSSHELRRGLEVHEHDGADGVSALGPLLPLGWWLQWELDAALAPSVFGR